MNRTSKPTVFNIICTSFGLGPICRSEKSSCGGTTSDSLFSGARSIAALKHLTEAFPQDLANQTVLSAFQATAIIIYRITAPWFSLDRQESCAILKPKPIAGEKNLHNKCYVIACC